MREFNVIKTAPGILVLEKSKTHHLMRARIDVAAFIFWCIVIYVFSRTPVGSPSEPSVPLLSGPFLWLLYLGPVGALHGLWKNIQIVRLGEEIVFDSATRTISKKSRILASFLDVESVDIKVFIDTDPEVGASSYQLSLIFKNRPSMTIADGINYADLAEIAIDVSNLLGVKVTRCSNKDWKTRDWNSEATETKIKLPYAPSTFAQVLRWGIDTATSPFTHQDIVHWCDDFYCEYLDVEAPPDIERILPILTEIREQWDLLLDSPIPLTETRTISPDNVHLPIERFYDWLRRIEA